MPPIALSSHNITFHNVRSSRTLLRRSPNSEGISSSPRRGFFGVMFKSLGSLAILEAILSNIMKAWAFVHPRHQRNLAVAQHAANMEWYEHHSAEWEEKQLSAEYKALKTYATEKPVSYCIMLPLKWEVGSRERKVYNGILRQVNEKFYEEYRDVLGEAMGDEDVQMEFEPAPRESDSEETE